MDSINDETALIKRADKLFAKRQSITYVRTDKVFGTLLILEWLAGILVALIISPRTWAGKVSDIHFHVLIAIVLGALIVARPIYLSYYRAGETLTRHSIAIAQILYAAMLIHLTGGRIETHFHIFGSLAFLSFYRDWRVIITASVVTALDHIIRGYFYPMSIYGTPFIQPFRWLEHTWWVIFEDYFLIRAMGANLKDVYAHALQQAELEETRAHIQSLVEERTKELKESRARLNTQYELTSTLANSLTLEQAAPRIMEAVREEILAEAGVVVGVLLEFQNPIGMPLSQSDIEHLNEKIAISELLGSADQLIEKLSLPIGIGVKSTRQLLSTTTERGTAELQCALSLPISAGAEIKALILFFSEKEVHPDAGEKSMLDSLCRQLSEFVEKRTAEQNNIELARIVQHGGDAIIGYGRDGRIKSWNEGAERLFGYRFEEMKNEHIGRLYLPDSQVSTETLLDGLKRGAIIERAEAKCLAKSGRTIDVSFTQSPVYDERKTVTGASLIMHDITERREAERRVGEFYSVVSHELRTPLTSIRSVLGLMEGGVIDLASDEAMELIQIARTSTDRLIRLINDMLDLKKIEAGKMEFHLSWGRSEAIIHSVIENLSASAAALNITLQPKITYEGPIFGDQDKLLQVLTNLVANAIKFSSDGGTIILDVSLEDRGNDTFVRFSVQDFGLGIAQRDMGKLFEKFQQLDSSDARKAGGTGLGLAICKAIITEHKGEIGAQSEEGKGSTFWFTLPCNANKAVETAPKTEGEKKEGFSILLVEDDIDLSKVLAKCLEKAGHLVNTASSIREAVFLLSSKRFDVLIVDIVLGDGNGLDLIQHLRDSESTASVPVIVITGDSEKQKARGHAMVFDWLDKPFQGSTLIEAVQRAIGTSSRKKVLVVDDDPQLRKVVSTQLRNIGLDCIEAADGLEAISLARTEHPELIILDVVLPKADAFKVLEVLKEGDTADIPLVIYTGKDLTSAERKKLSLGITRHLTKGRSDGKDLIDTVQSLLSDLSKTDRPEIQEAQ